AEAPSLFRAGDDLRPPVAIQVVATPEVAVRKIGEPFVPSSQSVEHDRVPAVIVVQIIKSDHELPLAVAVQIHKGSDVGPKFVEIVGQVVLDEARPSETKALALFVV